MVDKNTRDGDPYVKKKKKWLNDTFGGKNGYNNVTENGKTGWDTIYALTRAFQICLGLSSPANNFGPGTETAFKNNFPNGILEQPDQNTIPQHGLNNQLNDQTMHNIYGIIQGALNCKGYSYGSSSITCNFLTNTGKAIKRLKEDAGVLAETSTVTLNIMKALLSMDYFTSYNTSERTQNIILMQRYLNGNYENYIGIRPCDGVYGRRTSQGLIYAIQAEEGMPVGTANGNCGPATQKSLPNIPYNGGYQMNGQTYGLSYKGVKYSDSNITMFKRLAKIALYFNGYGSGQIVGDLEANVIKEFQKMYALSETGTIDFNTWLSLLISCGNKDRKAVACDCITKITGNNVDVLKNNGYLYIGRYLSNVEGSSLDKEMSLVEIKTIFSNGIRLFPIFQKGANALNYFNNLNAVNDAINAVNDANKFYLQFGTIIYFAVDFDATDAQITSNIIPYFKTLYSTFMSKCGGKYRLGIYGSRNVCTRVCNAGYACSSFVSDMSTGFSGNLGFTIPNNWAFDQFATTTISSNGKSIEIDKDGFSGRYKGISQEYSTIETSELNEFNTLANSFILINRGSSSIPVYEGKKVTDTAEGLRYVTTGNKIGEIKVNDFYIFFGLTDPDISDYIHKIMYNDGVDVKVGYVSGGPGYDDTNINNANWSQVPIDQDLFTSVNYIPNNNSYEFCAWSTPIEFTINKPVPYFKGADYQGMLNPGDKIKINAGNKKKPGASRPWTMFVDQIKWNGQETFENFNCFVSVGLEYASSGADRAWY